MKKFLYIALVALFAACTPAAVDYTSLYLQPNEVENYVAQQNGQILTLEQFKATYMTEKGNFYNDNHLYRTRATKDGVNYLFSIDTIPASDNCPIYIRGRITTDDYAGNFYKAICIQQIVDGKQ